MQCASTRPVDDVEGVVSAYGDTLYRLALVMLRNPRDAEDAVQDTIVKYLRRAPQFQNPEHQKAWLISVCANRCRDMRRFWTRHPQVDIDALQQAAPDEESSGILEALAALPDKLKIVMTLHYVEEYRIEDIARMIGCSASAVKMRLKKGRELLEATYRKEYL